MKSKFTTISKWLVRILLALGFLMAATGKLVPNPQVTDMFANWGYSNGFKIFIGVLEALGAIGLLIPRFTRIATFGLIVIMVGATITHIMHDPILQLLRPTIFSSLLVLNLYLSGLMFKLNWRTN